MMPHPPTPREVFYRLVDGVARLVAGDTAQVDRLAELYAEHTEVTHPMNPLGDTPLRTRADLRRHFAGSPGRTATALQDFHADDIVIHETADPEVIVAEFNYEGTGAGGPFSLPCVFVMRIRDGLIVSSRDYSSRLGFARAVGEMDSLFRELAAAG
jgi:ketosteroid isomerase-like protein